MISQNELKKVLNYSEYTGVFNWIKSGKVAGSVSECSPGYFYIQICIQGNSYLAHRLAWLYMNGEFPNKIIGHIDGDGLNNAILNLRDVSYTCNQQNAKLRSDNKSGMTGVFWCKDRKKWKCQITVNKKQISIGRYKTLKEAIKVRMQANIKYGFHENHGKRL